MSTANEILRDAFEMIGQYMPGETITAADMQRGLIALNDMIDQWSNENLACFAFLTQQLPLVNNQSQYTLGPGGDLAVRPLKIEQVYLIDQNGNRYNVSLRTQYDFNLLANAQVTSNLPSDAFYDPQFPVGILNFWPIPVAPLYTAVWTSYLRLTEFPDYATDIGFPPGYVAALKSNVAVRLCKYYGKAVPADVRAEANESKGTVKRKNQINQASYFDPAIVVRPQGSWNVMTGDYNGPRSQ